MDITEGKLALFDALMAGRGLENILEVAQDVMGNPLFVADMSLNVLAASSGIRAELEGMSEGDEGVPAAIRQASASGDFRRVYASDRAVRGSYLGFPYHNLAARLRVGSRVIGHGVVCDKSRAFEPIDAEVLPVVCQAISYVLMGGELGGEVRQSYEPLLEELLRGDQFTPAELKRRSQLVRPSPPSEIRVILISTTGAGGISNRYLRAQLLSCFPRSMACEYEGHVLQVVDGSLPEPEVEARLTGHVALDGYRVGLSTAARGLASLRVCYLQARAAIRLGRDVAGEPPIFRYLDVLPRHLREVAAEGVDSRVFDNPKLARLLAADARDGTSRVADLAAYLWSGRSITRAAQTMGVHKNSMRYRLERVGEMAGIDLSDERECFALQLALAMGQAE